MIWLLLAVLSSGTTSSLRGLSAVNDRVAWASGANGAVLRTVDGGATWKPAAVPDAANLDFRDVQAFSADSAVLMSAGAGPLSRVYTTADGGAHWNLALKNEDEKGFFDGIAFWNRKRGVLLGDAVNGRMTLLRTEDGGASWKPAVTPVALEGEGAYAASGTCVTVGRNGRAWFATGGGASARVFRSTDWGMTWQVSDTPMRHDGAGNGIFSIAFRDDLHGVAVGGKYTAPTESAGNIAFTEDGGVTWKPPTAQSPAGYRSAVLYADKGRLLIVTGTTGTEISKDGGATWQPLDPAGFHALSRGGKAVWASGDKGAIAVFRHLRKAK
jgi:photosystem II stability/assembly factor-like uncharacterized protein